MVAKVDNVKCHNDGGGNDDNNGNNSYGAMLTIIFSEILCRFGISCLL